MLEETHMEVKMHPRIKEMFKYAARQSRAIKKEKREVPKTLSLRTLSYIVGLSRSALGTLEKEGVLIPVGKGKFEVSHIEDRFDIKISFEDYLSAVLKRRTVQ